jgi:hypothetical protein
VWDVPRSKPSSASFSGDFNQPVVEDASVPEGRLVVATFTIEQLWREGGCTVWDVASGINQGVIGGLALTYSAIATNNAIPTGVSQPFAGQFFAPGRLPVDLDH